MTTFFPRVESLADDAPERLGRREAAEVWLAMVDVVLVLNGVGG